MKGHGTKFGRNKEAAIAALLTHRNIEVSSQGCRHQLTDADRLDEGPQFDQEYREARRGAFRQSVARLQQASGAAVTTLLKIMVDGSAPASTRLHAADIVLAHTSKAIEIEDVEARGAALERAAEASKQDRLQ